jgi:hypothetical protein
VENADINTYPEMSRMKLAVNLDHWIISDGNYEDFHAGEIRQFALEFYAPTQLHKVGVSEKKLQLIDKSKYRVTAEVLFASEELCVLDFGLLSYSQDADVRGAFTKGEFVEGEIYLGVDPFFYFEDLSKIEGVPALIYEWMIDSIEQDITPFVLQEGSDRFYVPDESRCGYANVLGTDENVSDEAIPASSSYVLHCAKTDTEPAKVLKQSVA